jgi:hypothetical protein
MTIVRKKYDYCQKTLKRLIHCIIDDRQFLEMKYKKCKLNYHRMEE